MGEENDVTANKLAEENQVIKKEPQRVTTKNPKKVEAGKGSVIFYQEGGAPENWGIRYFV